MYWKHLQQKNTLFFGSSSINLDGSLINCKLDSLCSHFIVDTEDELGLKDSLWSTLLINFRWVFLYSYTSVPIYYLMFCLFFTVNVRFVMQKGDSIFLEFANFAGTTASDLNLVFWTSNAILVVISCVDW